jgi:LmbE family N-acetylglucosaminyl deacetylase
LNDERRTLNPAPSARSRAARLLTLGWSDTQRGRLCLRRAASRIVRTALRLRSRDFPRGALASALVVAPHPDDETFGCGGAVAVLARDHAAVSVVFVTDGGASHPAHPSAAPAEIAALRRAEALSATGMLGVDPERVFFLDERDGALADLGGRSDEVARRISGILAQLAPEAVLLPCRADGSTEHEASFALVARALAHAPTRPRILEFPVWSWWNPAMLLGPLFTSRRVWRLDLRDALEVKARAIASYASQTRPIPPETSPALPPEFASLFLCGEEFFFEK